MVFKDKKIPKHLIIQEEFEFYTRPKVNIGRVIFWLLLVGGASISLLLIKQ
ncbi:hypothetical protein OAP18_01160 [Gammaproteobacteria bacterium]|nr:hypothetical protein [Gammaproteobacteria bacterium]MDC0598441.1 hypothetical protein [Gammaproteobacteria bacterium]